MKFLGQLRASSLIGPLVAAFGSFVAYAAGLGLVSAGAWLLSPAAGLIVAGLLLAATAIAYERHAAAAPRAPR